MIRKIVSGGQTGADRAALDVASGLGIPYGGWVPEGRLAEDGEIPASYPDLVEAPDADPSTRTVLNVRDSDATLILSHGDLYGGSELTASTASQAGKPWLHVDLARLSVPEAVRETTRWLEATRPATLNVAGPRSTDDPLIYSKTTRVLETVLLEQSHI